MKKNNKLLLILMLPILTLISIGYASYSSNLSISDIIAFVRTNTDIRVTGVSVANSNSGGISNYEDYNISKISSNIYLPNSDSSVTYKVTITNIDGPESGIYNITGLPDNLTYSMSNYVLKDKICDTNNNCSFGISKEIYITIKYKSYDSSKKTYDIKLDFDFREVHTITYENVDGNLYPREILKGDQLEIDFGANMTQCVIKNSDGTEIANDGTYYEFSDGKLLIYSVTDNLTISVTDKPLVATLLTTIKDKYLNAEKRVDTDYYTNQTYYYADSVSLMNDGMDEFGNQTNDETKGNIRYYNDGDHWEPINNYIYFNCDDYSNTSTCEKWRIIGIVEGKVKIVKLSSYTYMSWDYNYNDNLELDSGWETDWNTSSLKTYLNESYYYNIDSDYYNYITDNLGGGVGGRPGDEEPIGNRIYPNYSLPAQFIINRAQTNTLPYVKFLAEGYPERVYVSMKGITKATRDNNFILDSTWSLGAPSDKSSTNTIYIEEQQTQDKWFGKIALPDISDILFASKYRRDESGWLIESGWSLNKTDDNRIWYIEPYGNARTITPIQGIVENLGEPPEVHPTLYLNPDIIVDSETDGSESNPYKIVIE